MGARPRARGLLSAVLALPLLAHCSADVPDEEVAVRQSPVSVGGCTCPTSGGCSALSYSDIPADGIYYVTTFGGGADTQPMSCGGTADGTWAYVADSARFGCKSKLLIEAGGKSCVAEVRDCGPNRCVEQAACYCSCGGHFPIIDASPFITKYLFGASGMGWSDKKKVNAKLVDPATPIGCPGGPVTPADSGSGGGASDGALDGSGGGAQGGQSGGGGAGGSAGSAAGGAAGAAGASSGGSAGSGGSAAKPSSKDEASGCECRAAGAPRGSGAWLAGLGLAAVAARRRLRRAGA